MALKITNRYGIKIKGSIIPYGTNNGKVAKLNAKKWKGKVVDLAKIGKKIEGKGGKVTYAYRKK